MTARLNRRIAAYTLPNESTSEARVRRWAALCSILGYLQVLGAVLSLSLIKRIGFTPLTVPSNLGHLHPTAFLVLPHDKMPKEQQDFGLLLFVSAADRDGILALQSQYNSSSNVDLSHTRHQIGKGRK